MAKCYSSIVIIGITLALVSAELSWFRQLKRLGNLRIRNDRKLLGRQEQAPDAASSPAPYPPAGVTPEIPFDLPTETEAPDETFGPPNSNPGETYLPPEKTPDQTYGPPNFTPEQTYGPPAAEDIPPINKPNNSYIPPIAENEPDIEELPLVAHNSIQARVRSRSSQLRYRAQSQRSRLLALQPPNAPVQPRSNTLEIINSEPVLMYTLH